VLPIISGTLGLQICPEHSQAHSKQKAIKILETRGHGRSQGLSKIFRAAIYRAHRAVVFAIAQLSCFSGYITDNITRAL